MNPLIQLKRATPLFLVALACFGLSPTAQAQLSPPPDGGYDGENTAEGDRALFNLELFEAFANMAIGFEALFNNTEGDHNTATVFWAMRNNESGDFNTATGSTALIGNRTGHDSTAIGFGALGSNRSGSDNTATGDTALVLNTIGNNNTASGSEALQKTTGSNNIALGFRAGFDLTTGSGNIDIGNVGVTGESSTIRIGTFQTRTFIVGISGVAVTGSPVVVNANGRLGVTASSARFKEAIKPMDKASQALFSLKPVTFRYNKEIDSVGTPQFGLVAEHVERVSPDLVVRDKEGKPYSVRYEAVNAMLLNEFLKEHRKVQQLEKQVEKLTAGLQKVSAQLEAIKPAQLVVNNNQ